MSDFRTPPQTLSRREWHLVVLCLFCLVFLIAFGLYVALFTQPLSDLSPQYGVRPSHEKEAGQ